MWRIDMSKWHACRAIAGGSLRREIGTLPQLNPFIYSLNMYLLSVVGAMRVGARCRVMSVDTYTDTHTLPVLRGCEVW